ncbi:unnamed protein product, partial [marine sediment metagenome]
MIAGFLFPTDSVSVSDLGFWDYRFSSQILTFQTSY